MLQLDTYFYIMEATRNLRLGLYRHLYWKKIAMMAALRAIKIDENHMFEAVGEWLRYFWTYESWTGMSEVSFDFAAEEIQWKTKAGWSWRWNS